MSYKLISVKGNRTVDSNFLVEAIEAAKKMERQLQPAMGVTICDKFDEAVAEVRDGRVTLAESEDEDAEDECAA